MIFPPHRLHEARFDDVAAALQRSMLLVRLAGPMPAPQGDREEELSWAAWLSEDQALREAGEVSAAHDLACGFRFSTLEDLCRGASAPHDEVVDSEELLHWLLSARHARPLLRWARKMLDSGDPVPANVVLSVALAAFHFPPGEAVTAWCFLRWRRGWQCDLKPDPRYFLRLCGAALPALRRQVLPPTTPAVAIAR